MRADANGAGDEQDGDHARADRLEFCEAERVSWTGRPTGQPPRKQNDKVAQKVCRKCSLRVSKWGFCHSTSFKGLRVKCQSQWVDTSSMMDTRGACKGVPEGTTAKRH
jgi:hypothetical protein